MTCKFTLTGNWNGTFLVGSRVNYKCGLHVTAWHENHMLLLCKQIANQCLISTEVENMANPLIVRNLFPARLSALFYRRISSFFTDEYTPPKLDHVTSDWHELYKLSVKDPATFWGQLGASRLEWMKPFDNVMDVDLNLGQHRWFSGGKLNVSGEFLRSFLNNCNIAVSYPLKFYLNWRHECMSREKFDLS